MQFRGSSSQRILCSNGFDTMHVVCTAHCTGSLCVACIGLLSAEFSTLNTGLGKTMLWRPLCLLSINLHTLLKFPSQ